MRLPRRLSPRRPLTPEGCLDNVPLAPLPVLLCLAKGGALRVDWPDSRMPLVVRLNGWTGSPSAASNRCALDDCPSVMLCSDSEMQQVVHLNGHGASQSVEKESDACKRHHESTFPLLMQLIDWQSHPLQQADVVLFALPISHAANRTLTTGRQPDQQPAGCHLCGAYCQACHKGQQAAHVLAISGVQTLEPFKETARLDSQPDQTADCLLSGCGPGLCYPDRALHQ